MLTVLGVLLTQAVSAQERLVAALQRQADMDGSTGLAIRRVPDEALTAALSTAQGEEGTALVLMDVTSSRPSTTRTATSPVTTPWSTSPR